LPGSRRRRSTWSCPRRRSRAGGSPGTRTKPARLPQERLVETLNRLKGTGCVASGEVGVQDPIQACRDALRHRQVDEVILSTLPPGISRWLGQDVPSRLKGSIEVPVAVVTTQKQPAVTS
jgi:hypothetical protein